MLSKKDSKRFQSFDCETKARVLNSYLSDGLNQKQTAESVGEITNFDVSVILRGYGFNGINNGKLNDFGYTLDDYNTFVAENNEEFPSDNGSTFIKLITKRVEDKRLKESAIKDLERIVKRSRINARIMRILGVVISCLVYAGLLNIFKNVYDLSYSFCIIYSILWFLFLYFINRRV